MTFVRTKSFNLAIYIQGDPNSSKLALVLPGKLDTKDYAHMKSHVNFLADKGFFALSFDPPGTWESPGDINLYTTTNYLKAVDELIQYYGNKPTCIVGHSRGASVAMLAAINNSHITGFTAVFPAIKATGLWESLDITDWEKHGYISSKRDLPPGGGLKVKEFQLPFAFYKDQLQYSIVGKLEKLTKPKLFFLAQHDEIMQPETIRELYRVSAMPKELHELNSKHDYRLDVNLIDEVNHILGSFLEKNNL